MPRRARIIVPNVPHHVTQRGNRRQTTFFNDGDYLRYLQLAAEYCAKAQVECWGYCLMPNHVHLILAPKSPAGLREAMAPLHWRYTFEINKRERWTGYLWQGRFASCAMDDAHFIQASRYVGLNQCGQVSPIARRTGRGRVCARIWRARKTHSCAPLPCVRVYRLSIHHFSKRM